MNDSFLGHFPRAIPMGGDLVRSIRRSLACPQPEASPGGWLGLVGAMPGTVCRCPAIDPVEPSRWQAVGSVWRIIGLDGGARLARSRFRERETML